MLAYTETVKKLVEAYGYPEVRARPHPPPWARARQEQRDRGTF
jgi:hypothetical protein